MLIHTALSDNREHFMGCKDPHKMAGIWVEMILIVTLPVMSNPANQNVGLLTWGGLVVFTDLTYRLVLHRIMIYLICGCGCEDSK